MRAASVYVLSLVAAVLGSPALIAREDWKTERGWNGKTTTPAELDPSNVVKHTPNTPAAAPLNGGVFFCNGTNWTGQCLFVSKFTSGQCVNFGNEFNDKVVSFGPDPGIACLLYDAWDCKGKTPGGYIINPGTGNLAVYNFANVASSFACKAS
ncbi:hypothetical protein RhiJN_06164 [Ceratobasidium sp. AG-Ba]|nr:hypothetical protein RhiJN_06164 [Ceratobasidium sp. AG-Ba]QRW07111.1 hypothetical protein RhiLY_06110 [Ceratobasidium sp. AG-Ba]